MQGLMRRVLLFLTAVTAVLVVVDGQRAVARGDWPLLAFVVLCIAGAWATAPWRSNSRA